MRLGFDSLRRSAYNTAEVALGVGVILVSEGIKLLPLGGSEAEQEDHVLPSAGLPPASDLIEEVVPKVNLIDLGPENTRFLYCSEGPMPDYDVLGAEEPANDEPIYL